GGERGGPPPYWRAPRSGGVPLRSTRPTELSELKPVWAEAGRSHVKKAERRSEDSALHCGKHRSGGRHAIPPHLGRLPSRPALAAAGIIRAKRQPGAERPRALCRGRGGRA